MIALVASGGSASQHFKVDGALLASESVLQKGYELAGLVCRQDMTIGEP